MLHCSGDNLVVSQLAQPPRSKIFWIMDREAPHLIFCQGSHQKQGNLIARHSQEESSILP